MGFYRLTREGVNLAYIFKQNSEAVAGSLLAGGDYKPDRMEYLVSLLLRLKAEAVLFETKEEALAFEEEQKINFRKGLDI